MADRENMVLRTIYLPVDVDRKLREFAFSRDVSKAELMRTFITEGLTGVKASGEKTLAERVGARAASRTAAAGFEDLPAAPASSLKLAERRIRDTVRPEGLVSFIDGKTYKTLKRHLTAHGMDMAAYRERYGLPPDYPTTSAEYSAQRSALARSLGLGKSATTENSDVPAKSASARRRSKKAPGGVSIGASGRS